MESVYRWKGADRNRPRASGLHQDDGQAGAALQARLHELHAYEVPEFIVVPVVGGSDAYLQWVRESTAG